MVNSKIFDSVMACNAAWLPDGHAGGFWNGCLEVFLWQRILRDLPIKPTWEPLFHNTKKGWKIKWNQLKKNGWKIKRTHLSINSTWVKGKCPTFPLSSPWTIDFNTVVQCFKIWIICLKKYWSHLPLSIYWHLGHLDNVTNLGWAEIKHCRLIFCIWSLLMILVMLVVCGGEKNEVWW